MRIHFLIFLLIELLVPPNNQAHAQADRLSWTNPLLMAPSQDPWIIRNDSFYYYCESPGRAIALRRTTTFADLRQQQPRMVWKVPAAGPFSQSIWAPELHFLEGMWYIYFAADDGRNEHHRMWVIHADNPMGPYSQPVLLETGGWAIDGTILRTARDSLFFVWSGWPDSVNGTQQLYIAPMKNPTTIGGRRTLLATPTESWERNGMPICEGPTVLQRNGRTFLVYSASGSWTRHYCLGMLALEGSNVTDPSAWRKIGPVFASTDSVFGVGHCSFTVAPDGASDIIFYHAKSSSRNGWSDRQVHAQPFGWSDEGSPEFGTPIAPGVLIEHSSAGVRKR